MVDGERMELALAGRSAKHRRAGPQRRVDSAHDGDAGGALGVCRMANGDADGAQIRRHGVTLPLSLPAVSLGTRGIARRHACCRSRR